MQFLLYGAVHPDVQAALERHEHTCHAPSELSDLTDIPTDAAEFPKLLLPLLTRKQWNLVTDQADFVHALYEEKVEFTGVIVLILGNLDSPDEHRKAIDRLFERYKRLTQRRLYTITPSRVKIRQLPGRPD